MISVQKTKTNVSRLFAITDENWSNYIKKYFQLRSANTIHKRFFVCYRSGRCTTQPIGINKIGEMPKIIAKYLNLLNYEHYTGHCFRRSSASHLANSGADLITIKKHAGWKSSAVAEGYLDASLKRKMHVSTLLSSASSNGENVAGSSKTVTNTTVVNCQKNLPSTSVSTGDNCTVNVNVYNYPENKEN